jgi:hypothetical protein
VTHSYAPVALFVYNRPDLTRRTLEALASNRLAEKTSLFVFADGPRRPEDTAKVQEARLAAASAKGFAAVTMLASVPNLGLSRSIIGGVTRLTEEFGEAIVLEDDIVTSPYFLDFMNDALEKYSEVERVAAVSGYLPPFDTQLPETFFQRDAECWGWATWKRAWRRFNPDGRKLLDELRRQGLLKFFDQDGTATYVDMLERQIAGKNDSWAVRWRASVILADMLSLYPGRSLTENIGFDGSGTHADASSIWQVRLSSSPVMLSEIALSHSPEVFEAFKRFNRSHGINSSWRRMKERFKALRRKMAAKNP